MTFLLSINMRKTWDFSLFSSFQSFLCTVFCRILGKKLSGQSLRIMLFSPKQGLASNKASCCKVSWFLGKNHRTLTNLKKSLNALNFFPRKLFSALFKFKFCIRSGNFTILLTMMTIEYLRGKGKCCLNCLALCFECSL